MAHTLTVTRPDGRELIRTCDELHQIANEVRWLLNGPEFKIPRADCTAFAADVIGQPAGTVATHGPTGLAFTVTSPAPEES